jgi:hypothetical protein
MSKTWIAPAIEEQASIVAQLGSTYGAGPGSGGGGGGGNNCCPGCPS